MTAARASTHHPLAGSALLVVGLNFLAVATSGAIAQQGAPAAGTRLPDGDTDTAEPPGTPAPAPTALEPTPGGTTPQVADNATGDVPYGATPEPPEEMAAKRQAQRLYEAALREYDEGNHAAALGLLQRASQLYDSPLFLFNIAQTRRRLGQCAAAREDYLNYLALETDPERRALAEVGLDRLRTCTPPGSAAAPVAPVPVESSGDPVWIGWTAAAVLGAAWITTGSVTLATLLESSDAAGRPGEITPQEQADLEDRGKAWGLAADLLGVATVAAVGVSLVWTLADSHASEQGEDHQAPDTAPAMTATVGPGGFSLQGSF